jgi:hypothetical protein
LTTGALKTSAFSSFARVRSSAIRSISASNSAILYSEALGENRGKRRTSGVVIHRI